MPHSDFVHLHNHTQYSLLDASAKVRELIRRAVELKFPAIAMTDHGNLFGAIEFYSQAVKQGIKPIFSWSSCFVRSQEQNIPKRRKCVAIHESIS